MHNNVAYLVLLSITVFCFGVFLTVMFKDNSFIGQAQKVMADFIASTRPSV